MFLNQSSVRATLYAVLISFAAGGAARAQLRDGGIDPKNLGKGDWIYSMTDATNKLGGHIASVTNETSLMLYYSSVGVRYMIVKAATSDQLFNGCYNRPQFSSNLCNIARTNGILIFGYNRSYGANVPGELAVVDYVFNQGADGFVYDAEAEWESHQPWIGANGPALAWQLCSTARSNWPTKFFAHAPFPIIYLHSSFPYKEFGYWCDTVMPQIYHFSSTGLRKSPSACINWSDVNWKTWQSSLFSLPPNNINGLTVYWTNAIKPITPLQDVYGPAISGGVICEGTASAHPDKDVMEFIDYSAADPHTQTAGGYRGINFWRTDLHGSNQWSNIQNGTSGNFVGTVNNIVIDNPNAVAVGGWISVKVFAATTTTPTYFGATGSDTNSFGTNYLARTKGTGSAYVEFTPNVVMAGSYDVFQWHPFVTNASSGTPFLIIHSAGATTVNANQKTNDGNWSILGRFYFTNGTAGKIRVLDSFSDGGSVAIADGIKLIFVPPTNPPAGPTSLNATALSSSQIKLTWTDNATNELVFAISRSLASSGPYTNIGAVSGNSTSFTNTGLAAGTPYYYLVRATNAAGSSSNAGPASATTLFNPPIILTPPQSQNLFNGQTAVFNVAATGTGPLSYQWRFGGVPIPGATATNYTIASVQTTNSGAYSVVVSNAASTVTSSNATLLVQSVAAFGNNAFGQLNISNLTNAIAVAAGSWHSLALLDDGHILAWGDNFNGQCAVPPTVTNAMAIAGGGYHSLAIRSDGTVLAWGANDYGQTSVPQNLNNVVGIAAGTWHSLALKSDGTVVAWGDNTWGQIAVPPGLVGVIAVAAGGNHSLALRSNGTVVAWGQNEDAYGIQVGQSIVPPGLGNVVAIAAGDYHSFAVKSNGAVIAWGDNSSGQTNVPAGLSNVVAIAGGGNFSLALRADGSLAGWGANGSGQFTFPSAITNVVAFAAGNSHTLVILDGVNLPAPRLLNLTLASSRFAGLVPSVHRKNYALEFKDSLLNPTWATSVTNRGNGALIRMSDPNAPAPSRFYRVRRW